MVIGSEMISMGVFLRAVGFIMLAYVDGFLLLLLSMIVIGFGGVLFETPYQTAIAALTTEANRSQYYSLNNTIVGIASTLGRLIEAFLLRYDFKIVCFGAALCFLINFEISRISIPIIIRMEKLLTIKESIYENPESVGWMYSIYAAVTAVLQYPLVSLMLKKYIPRQIVVLGISIIAMAIIFVPFISTTKVFLAVVVLFMLGMLLARPNQQAIAVSLANSKTTGLYLGFAFRSGFRTVIGGSFFDLSKKLDFSNYLSLCFVG